MAALELRYPVEGLEAFGYRFGQRVRSRFLLWARHLGEDIVLPAGTSVKAIGEGKVVWAEMRKGNLTKRNWGGLVVIEHAHGPEGKPFYSLYGHMQNLAVKVGDVVVAGQQLGVVAPSYTPENGWWKVEHLHFAIYVGPWMQQVLPGYKRFFESRTRFHWWRDPLAFIKEHNGG